MGPGPILAAGSTAPRAGVCRWRRLRTTLVAMVDSTNVLSGTSTPVYGLRAAALGTAAVALASTFADALRAAADPGQRAAYGVVHGVIVLTVLGLTLAALVRARARVAGALGALLTGIGAAALFYVLYPLVGIPAMLVAWLLLWLALAFLVEALAPAALAEKRSRTLTRGVAAAVLSGLGFWVVSGTWLAGADPGPLYLRNLASWGVAFLPGLLALFVGRPEAR